ncbi:MAG: hypothetical protein JJE22_15695 [Bacteroidia bacterium]|nr:hypothetical protein [Bacteroidia bacterium]
MKKYQYSLLAILILFVTSCRKSDNPRIPTLQRVPVPYIIADATKSASIDVLNPASFSQTFTFDPYFPSDVPPKQMDLVAIKNGDKSTVKTIQAGFTTFPATANITGAQLINLFGNIVLGDNFTFGLDITTQDGMVYHAFPAAGVGYGSGVFGEYAGSTNTTPIANGGGVVYQLNFGAICAYDPNIYQGNFVVVQDDWQDLNPGDIVLLTKVSDNSFSFTYPDPFIAPFPPPAITVVVNTGNNNITVAKQQLGTKIYGVYDNPNVQGTVGNVKPCDQTVTVDLNWTVTQGNFGTYTLVLKKP